MIFFILITTVLGGLALAFATQWISAQDAAKKPKPGQTVRQDSKAAWDELRQSAQSRLHSANDQSAIVREIMNELAVLKHGRCIRWGACERNQVTAFDRGQVSYFLLAGLPQESLQTFEG